VIYGETEVIKLFRTEFGKTVFFNKYRNKAGGCDTWEDLCDTLVKRVCTGLMHPGDMTQLAAYMREMKFIPAGRYLYYAGREAAFFNNCFSFTAEDSREGWADLGYKHFMALMVGGGCGTYYGEVRPRGELISRTGGVASGPIPLMHAMNEIGRNVQQGGSRRSALYGSLPALHENTDEFLVAKDWSEEVKALKAVDFNFPAPLDMTNISVQYDDITQIGTKVFNDNVYQACKTGEPGMQFDFYAPNEVGRNACAEFITDQDSDLCNLGSINLSRIGSIEELRDVTYLASQFLACGSIRAELPYQRCYEVRESSRKIGLGLMGVHEWCIRRGYKYGASLELKKWLFEYQAYSEVGANEITRRNSVTDCIRFRSVAPAGTISILAGTTSGIEPLFATGIKRRFLEGSTWKYQYIAEPFVKYLVTEGIDPAAIETSSDLAKDIERRLAFQADVQKFVDMGISSTINLPEWGSEYNNEDTVDNCIQSVKKYATELRGLTFYPDGSRGGQPLTPVSFKEAIENEGTTFTEGLDFLETVSCPSGACGI